MLELDTVQGRATAALHEAMLEVGTDDNWKRKVASVMLAHISAELIVLEQQAGCPCTLQDAVAFLCHAAEGRA
mgnify:FL=1